MTASESKLLDLILSDTLAAEKLPQGWYPPMSSEEWQRIAPIVLNLPKHGVRISANWLGHDPASRQARSRGLKSLESAGLVELIAATGAAASHAKLTPTGRKLAKAAAPKPAKSGRASKG